MSPAKLVGSVIALAGAALVAATTFMLAGGVFDFIRHRERTGWNGWPDLLFFTVTLAAFVAIGAACARWGWRMTRDTSRFADQGAMNLVGLALTFAAFMGVAWAMRSTLDRLRWACAGVLGLLWLTIAVSNARIGWRDLVQGEKKGPSVVMLVGAIVGLAAVNVIPHHWDGIKWPLRLAVILLDFGSAPMLVIGVGVICREMTRGSK